MSVKQVFIEKGEGRTLVWATDDEGVVLEREYHPTKEQAERFVRTKYKGLPVRRVIVDS